MSYICLISLGLHLGINFNSIFNKFNLNIILKIIIDAMLIVYGIYSFIKLDIIKHITGTYGFSIIEGNIIINIFRYLSIVMMFAIVIKYFFKRRKK